MDKDKFITYRFPDAGVFVKDPTKVLTVTMESNPLFDGPSELDKMMGTATECAGKLLKLGWIKQGRYDQLMKLVNTKQKDNVQLVLNIIKAKVHGE